MRKPIIITSIEMLRQGMEVEFRHCCLSRTYKAVVSDIKYRKMYRMVDRKPARTISVESATLTCSEDNFEGKEITITESNFRNFKIHKIK